MDARAVCCHYVRQIQIPIVMVYLNNFSHHRIERNMESFGNSIRFWVIERCVLFVDIQNSTYLAHQMSVQFSSIICQ